MIRKFLIPAALLASTVAAVAPAAAQWAPPPPPGYAYGYGAPQGNAYGYDNYGQVRRLEARVDRLRRMIQHLDRRNIISNREARRLDAEARDLQMRVRQLSYGGLNPRERYEIERRIDRLEYRIQREAQDRNNRFGSGYGDGHRDRDRDHDGRDDRYEDDRGRDRD
jgi:hypothetical protein